MASAAVLTAPLAVIDVETTGLHPGYHHRVIEIGVVTIDVDGRQAEWDTLVNPGRDLGPQGIHGIRGVDVTDAPAFAEVVGDFIERVDGRALVAHNATFDRLFIEAELERVGMPTPSLRWYCSMAMGTANGWRASLRDCCADAGVAQDAPHCALDDARTCARLVMDLVTRGRQPAWEPSSWPQVARPSGLRRRRGDGALRPAPSAFALLAREAVEIEGDRHPAYTTLIGQAMEDRVLTPSEREALAALAVDLGLTDEERLAAHRGWLGRLLALAQRDGQVTERERADLALAADTLDVDLGTIGSVVDDSDGDALSAGTSVCFTGALECTIEGEAITRERACALAERAGLVVLNNVTRKCDVLVIADPHSQSAKARRARELGTRIIAEASFWSLIGVDVH